MKGLLFECPCSMKLLPQWKSLWGASFSLLPQSFPLDWASGSLSTPRTTLCPRCQPSCPLFFPHTRWRSPGQSCIWSLRSFPTWISTGDVGWLDRTKNVKRNSKGGKWREMGAHVFSAFSICNFQIGPEPLQNCRFAKVRRFSDNQSQVYIIYIQLTSLRPSGLKPLVTKRFLPLPGGPKVFM